MLEALISFALTILEKITLGWWTRRKVEEADNVQNKVISMSDATVDKQLQQWKRPD